MNKNQEQQQILKYIEKFKPIHRNIFLKNIKRGGRTATVFLYCSMNNFIQ